MGLEMVPQPASPQALTPWTAPATLHRECKTVADSQGYSSKQKYKACFFIWKERGRQEKGNVLFKEMLWLQTGVELGSWVLATPTSASQHKEWRGCSHTMPAI